MLLTLTTTHRPATDLGYLLHKNPGALRSVDVWFGRAHVFYPEATFERCTAALLIHVDPIGLVRRKARGGEPASLEPYVNDRPYAASSFVSVALAKLFGTAMRGRSAERQELADTPITKSASPPCPAGEGRRCSPGCRAARVRGRGHADRTGRAVPCVFGVLALESEPVDPRL